MDAPNRCLRWVTSVTLSLRRPVLCLELLRCWSSARLVVSGDSSGLMSFHLLSHGEGRLRHAGELRLHQSGVNALVLQQLDAAVSPHRIRVVSGGDDQDLVLTTITIDCSDLNVSVLRMMY